MYRVLAGSWPAVHNDVRLLSEMKYWIAGALLFCVGLVFWYRTLVRPELIHMSSVRKLVLLFATVIVILYQISMAQVDIARHLHILTLAMILLLSSAASAALTIELVRIAFFAGRTWHDKFHFSLVVFCCVVIFLIQFTLVIASRNGLFKG